MKYVSITGSMDKADELTERPWTPAKLNALVSHLRNNDRDGLAFCFNNFVQACLKARWRQPLQDFVDTARKNSPHKAIVEQLLKKSRIRWLDADSRPMPTASHLQRNSASKQRPVRV
ncbi:MAG: hypothetical protein QW568_03185 [Candidatus Anstonellaceae archaeon]